MSAQCEWKLSVSFRCWAVASKQRVILVAAAQLGARSARYSWMHPSEQRALFTPAAPPLQAVARGCRPTQ